VKITRPKDKPLVLNKHENTWQIVEPQKMPAIRRDQQPAVVAEKPAGFGVRGRELQRGERAQFERPVLTVGSAPMPAGASTTAPRPSRPHDDTFGQYENALKDKVYVMVSDPKAVPSARRGRSTQSRRPGSGPARPQVLDIAPSDVMRLSIVTDTPATTKPTTKPRAMCRSPWPAALWRRQVRPPPPRPSPRDSSRHHAGLHPTRHRPALSHRMELTSAAKADADDVKIQDLLAKLNPLRARSICPIAHPPRSPRRRWSSRSARHRRLRAAHLRARRDRTSRGGVQQPSVRAGPGTVDAMKGDFVARPKARARQARRPAAGMGMPGDDAGNAAGHGGVAGPPDKPQGPAPNQRHRLSCLRPPLRVYGWP